MKKACAHPDKVIIFPLDLTDPKGILEKASKFINENNRKIDILINNGGISMRSGFMENSFENEETIMNVNYLSQVALVKVLFL